MIGLHGLNKMSKHKSDRVTFFGSDYLRIVPGDDAVVERIREATDTFGGEVGISAWNGFAMARFCAQDAARLRADMMAVLGRASAMALPRMWLN